MADLLLELYSEEIPALIQKNMSENLSKFFSDGFFLKNIEFTDMKLYCSPCRITLTCTGIVDTLKGYVLEKRGPKVGSDHNACIGFAKSVGKNLEDLEISDIKGEKYYFLREEMPAEPVSNLLPKILKDLIAKIAWPKSMFWGSSDINWVRPLRNILCLFNGKVIEFNYGNLISNNITFGHKFLNHTRLEIGSIEDYKQKLKEHKVVYDEQIRRTIILEAIEKFCKEKQLNFNQDNYLLDEVVGLVESPNVLVGSIPEKFLNIPQEIIITAMKTHQKYFSVSRPSGKIAPYFIFVSNINTDNDLHIIHGNEKVLNARLSDAKFFYEQDLKVSLLERYEKELSRIMFHNRLGSMKDKADRLVKFVEFLEPNNADLKLAAKLAKADLTSNVVREFPELQGVIGKYYAKAEGLSTQIAEAIGSHYLPQSQSSECPSGIAAIISLIDKLDNLIGFTIIGEKATGSKDPYALRRSAIAIINIILQNSIDARLTELIDYGIKLYQSQSVPVNIQPLEIQHYVIGFIEERFKNLFKDKLDSSIINAVLKSDYNKNILIVKERMYYLQGFFQKEEGADILKIFKRCKNILSSEMRNFKGSLDKAVKPELLHAEFELPLYKLVIDIDKSIITKSHNNFESSINLLKDFSPLVNKFFDNVLVISEDTDLSENRLLMLNMIVKTFLKVLDFNEF